MRVKRLVQKFQPPTVRAWSRKLAVALRSGRLCALMERRMETNAKPSARMSKLSLKENVQNRCVCSRTAQKSHKEIPGRPAIANTANVPHRIPDLKSNVTCKTVPHPKNVKTVLKTKRSRDNAAINVKKPKRHMTARRMKIGRTTNASGVATTRAKAVKTRARSYCVRLLNAKKVTKDKTSKGNVAIRAKKKEDPCALVDCMDVECTPQEISFTPEGECCSECKKCDDVVDCFADPCATSTCSVAGATCESNYCGGCNAVWSIKGEVLDEKQCAPEYNCQTEELWTNEKKNWCCEHEDECAQKCSTVRCILGAACDDTEEWYRPFGQCCSSCKPKESDCDGTLMACLVRPCSVTTCDAHPDAVCADDYCDGCNAIFTLDGEVLSKDECEKEEPEFNCQTRELWTNEKQVWCCKNEERGCDAVCETSDGDMYALGASWQPDACTYCSCDDPGTAKQGICAVMDCMPPLCGLDEEMVTQEGKCCPTCVKKVVESSECPANCGDGTCKGDQCTSCGTQNKAIAKGTDADGFFGKCLNTLYCDSNKIVQNTANAGKPCKCSLNKCQYCVTKGAEQEVCKKCQSGFYLLDGQCVESCSDEHAAVGINEVGRKCMEPFSCVKGRMVGGGGGKCKCATPDNGFHRTCHACTFQAGGIGDVCTKCKSGKFLNPATAQCQDACDGLAGLIHYGDNELGNECRKPFTCANGLDEDSRKCKCSSASGGRKCASCEWGADGDTCTLCKRGAYLHNGVCVKQCPQGTTEVGTKTVGRVCE